MKLRIHSYSIEEVEGTFPVLNRGQEIGYFDTLLQAVAYAILFDLGRKHLSQQEQIQRVAKAIEALLQFQKRNGNRGPKQRQKVNRQG